jgi:ring-1,2-phenylacetyl-CoA epoxidase subunit PaaD
MEQRADPTTAEVWAWLSAIEDPEIPAISIVDLGIVRDVAWGETNAGTECVVTVTPTYSGCPATSAIARSIVEALQGHGITRIKLETRMAPPWTTDWMSAAGKEKLKAQGIAPPASQRIPVSAIRRSAWLSPRSECPRCKSPNTELISQFGSTPCKALYRCQECREPFDYFKSH